MDSVQGFLFRTICLVIVFIKQSFFIDFYQLFVAIKCCKFFLLQQIELKVKMKINKKNNQKHIPNRIKNKPQCSKSLIALMPSQNPKIVFFTVSYKSK